MPNKLQSNALRDAANSIQRFANPLKGLLALATEMERGASVLDAIADADRRVQEIGAREAAAKEGLLAKQAELAEAERKLAHIVDAGKVAKASVDTHVAQTIAAAKAQAAGIIEAANADKAAAATDRAKARELLAQASNLTE